MAETTALITFYRFPVSTIHGNVVSFPTFVTILILYEGGAVVIHSAGWGTPGIHISRVGLSRLKLPGDVSFFENTSVEVVYNFEAHVQRS